MDHEISQSMVEKGKEKSNMNKERVGSTHSMCLNILLRLASNCQSQMAQTI